MGQWKIAIISLVLFMSLLASIVGTGAYLFDADRRDTTREYRPE